MHFSDKRASVKYTTDYLTSLKNRGAMFTILVPHCYTMRHCRYIVSGCHNKTPIAMSKTMLPLRHAYHREVHVPHALAVSATVKPKPKITAIGDDDGRELRPGIEPDLCLRMRLLPIFRMIKTFLTTVLYMLKYQNGNNFTTIA